MKTRLTRRRWFRAACALAPFVAVVLVVGAAHDSSPWSPASVTSRSPAGSGPTVAASAGAAGGGAARTTTSSRRISPGTPPAAGRDSGTAGDLQSASATGVASVTAWGAAHAALLRDLRTDVTNVDADATNQELPALTGDCARLQTDLQLAQNAPPVPDPTEDSLWNEALGDFTRAILECVGGVQDRDVSKLSEAAQDTSNGETTLTALASRIGAGGSS